MLLFSYYCWCCPKWSSLSNFAFVLFFLLFWRMIFCVVFVHLFVVHGCFCRERELELYRAVAEDKMRNHEGIVMSLQVMQNELDSFRVQMKQFYVKVPPAGNCAADVSLWREVKVILPLRGVGVGGDSFHFGVLAGSHLFPLLCAVHRFSTHTSPPIRCAFRWFCTRMPPTASSSCTSWGRGFFPRT